MTRVTLSGFIIVPEESLAEIESELPNHIRLTRQEPGCLSFEVSQSPSDRHRFDVHEVFDNRAAFDLHQQRVRSSRWGQITTNVERHYEVREAPAVVAVKQPLHEDDLEAETWYEGTDREIRGRALCDVGGRSKVGVGLLELPAGSNTRPSHYHTREEEHLYALEGQATLILGDTSYRLVRGSYVCFPAGQALTHHLRNDGPAPFRYLMIGERIDDDQVISDED